MTIFAFTQTGYQHNYPGYVNISKRGASISLTVRTPGQPYGSELAVPEDEVKRLYVALHKHFENADPILG
jgi:hypothetical protein